MLKDWKSGTPYKRDRASGQHGRQGGEGRHRDAGQGQRRLRRRPRPGHERRALGLPGPGGRQLHLRRRPAGVAAGQPRPPQGRPVLRRRLRLCRPGTHRQGGRTSSCSPSPTRRTWRRWTRPSPRRWSGSSRTGRRRRRSRRRARRTWRAAKNQRSSDGALAVVAVGQLYAGRTSAYLAEFEKKVGEADGGAGQRGVPQQRRSEAPGHHRGGGLQEEVTLRQQRKAGKGRPRRLLLLALPLRTTASNS